MMEGFILFAFKICLATIGVAFLSALTSVGALFYFPRRCVNILKEREAYKMGRHPDLEKLNDLFTSGNDFQLSDKQYAKLTGAALPKEKSYIKNGSALSRKATEHNYEIVDVQDAPVIVRTVFFKKK